MWSQIELAARWRQSPPSPRGRGTVRLIVARTQPGEHEVLESGHLDPEAGLVGDRWSAETQPQIERQVTLMELRAARALVAEGQPLHSPGDNFLVELDLSEHALPAGTRLFLGEALVEVTATPHLGCVKFRDRFGAEALRWIHGRSNRALRLRGLHCRVLEAGEVQPGDPVEVIATPATS